MGSNRNSKSFKTNIDEKLLPFTTLKLQSKKVIDDLDKFL